MIKQLNTNLSIIAKSVIILITGIFIMGCFSTVTTVFLTPLILGVFIDAVLVQTASGAKLKQ
jgi:hypothetical protein